jgi:crooked neck
MSFKQVKNRAPAPIQITAEQLLREAKERGIDDVEKAPDVHIKDREELLHYQITKRKGFEDQLRGKKSNINIWVRYALWEASQKEFERARSVFERALDIDYKSQTLWLKYAEMEMKHKFINHARNIWDRCVAYLPRADVYWYKYTYMEELIGAIGEARNVFERWMKWEPDDNAWNAYVKFECRQNSMENAIKVMERYIACHPTVKAYLKYATWLEKLGYEYTATGMLLTHSLTYLLTYSLPYSAREIYERALVELHEMEVKEKILIRFARFEINCKEYERARIIYKYALEQMEKKGFASNEAQELKQEYIVFEKKYGNRQGIEDAILETRRTHYQGIVQQDPYNYDAWFDYARLEENEGEYDRIRAVYTQAVSNNPPINEKRYWYSLIHSRSYLLTYLLV